MKTKRQTENARFVQSVGGRTPEICYGCSEKRQDVRDADLRVGKWQRGGEETVKLLTSPHWIFISPISHYACQTPFC
jgi:hypothetical protein